MLTEGVMAMNEESTAGSSPSSSIEDGFEEKTAREWAMILHFSMFAGYLVPIAGFIAPIIIWQIKKDELHTGKVTLNLKHCKQNNDYTPKYKCYTPNSVYISELTKYKYSQQTGSEISIIDKETAFVIPIGVSVDKPIITTILHNIVQ
jgi:hypothetical protein